MAHSFSAAAKGAAVAAGMAAVLAGIQVEGQQKTSRMKATSVNEIEPRPVTPFETQGPQGDMSGLKRIPVGTINEISPKGVISQMQRPYAKAFGATFETDSAVFGMNGRAQCSSIHRCGEFVRYGLEDGGINTRAALINRELTDAYKYDKFLTKQGFRKIGHRLDSYTPKAGDIMVFDKTINHASGHIQMFNGTSWVSDFVQQTPYPWADYGRYSIFRW